MRGNYSLIISLIIPIVVYFDSVYHNIGLLAMLDPFLGFFYQRWYLCFYKVFITVKGLFQEGDILYKLRQAPGSLLIRYYIKYYIVFLVMLIISPLSRINYFGFDHWLRVAVVDAFCLACINEISSGARTLDTCTLEIPGKPFILIPKAIRKFSTIQIRKSNQTP